MTKKEYIKNSMFYTGETNVLESVKHLKDSLKDITKGKIKFSNSVFIEPSAGDGSFTNYLNETNKNLTIFSLDTHPEFEGCREGNFLDVKSLSKIELDYKIFIGFPPVRKYEDFVKHSIELGADVIAYIMPMSSINKKNRKVYSDNNYSIIYSDRVITSDFKLPNGSDWDFSGLFVVIMKDEHIEKQLETNSQGKSYKDFFDVYTINKSRMTIKETSQPNLFRDGRVPKNRKTGEPYKLLTDENGKKYYYQYGINMDKIDQCDLFLPLRVFPSKEEGMILYDTFDDKTFAKIGFGLKAKEGYVVRKVKGKIIYYLYREKYRGIYTLVAKLDDEVVRNFYARKRYNNGVYVSSKKLIQSNKKGIL